MHADTTVVRYRIVYEHVNARILCARATTDKLTVTLKRFEFLYLYLRFPHYLELNKQFGTKIKFLNFSM